MQQAERAGQSQLLGRQHEHFALHPAQSGEFVARGIAPAVDGPVLVVGQRRGVGLEPEFDVGHGEKAPDNRLKSDARIEMGLARKIQGSGKTTAPDRAQARRCGWRQSLQIPACAGQRD